MDRSLTLILFSLSALFVQGQVLTEGEVYDFDIGDVFQTEYPQQNGSISTWTDTIVGKTLYTAGDSVNYMIHRVKYAPASGPGLPPFLQDHVISRTYFSLSNTATQYQLQYPCPPIVDTVFNDPDYCGRTVWRETTLGDTCFEYDSWTSYLIQGCGGPYVHAYEYLTDNYIQSDLTYFKKGTLECGTFHSIPSGILELDAPQVRMVIAPIPSSDRITVHVADAYRWSSKQVELTITDLQGRTLRSRIVDASEINGLQWDIQELPAAIYMLNMAVDGRVLSRSRLVKL